MYYPLSQTQMGIYVTCMNNQEEGNYNINKLFRLDDDIDIERLARALDKVIEAHPYVKSRLVTNDEGEVVFEDHSQEEFHTSINDVNDIEYVRPHLGEDYILMQDQLFRLEIYRTHSGTYLYVDFHHIIFDGMSWSVFTEDLANAYAGNPLEKEAIDGYQIAEQEILDRKTEAYAEAKQWYTQEFGGATEVESMPLADIYGNDEVHYSRQYIKLDVDKAAIEVLCQKAGVRESMLFTAAFGFTLSKYAAEEEVLYNTIFHGRNDKQTRHSFCMMVKTLPVYHNLTNTPTVVELLRQTSEQIKASRQHAIYSYGEAATELGLKSDVNFAYQGELHALDIVLNGRKQQSEDLITNTPGIKLLNMIMIEEGDYYAWCEYQSNKYSKEFILGFWAAYEHILGEMCKKDNLAEIEICSSKQIAQLDSFNHPIPETQEETVIGAFLKTAKQYPDNIAAVFKEKKYTYKELDELTDKIASVISLHISHSSLNIKKEPVVSILIPRNEYMFVLPLAAMKAGCAYQPLDPSYPQERLNFMVKDADAALLIADPELRDIINEYEGEVILTSELENVDSSLNIPHSSLNLTPSSLFILLYTSGSTGVPKGVMLEHGNLIAFCNWYRRYYDLKPEHNVAAYASFGFDACMMDLYPALTTGATVHIIPEEIRLDLISLNDYFEANNITHSFITTQVGVQFLLNTENHSLHHLSVGGEKLVSVDPAIGYTFHNGYGPTECTIFSTTLPVMKNEKNIPIGKPVDSLNCFVVDKNGHRLPVGAAGELIIVGPQVGRGYLNRPDKTAEAFFTLDGQRAYHSGDIVRYREDGNIEFVGRKDGQVKIRGFRIELKEVEAVIRDFEGIKDVTVQAFDDPNGGKFIAAYIVSDSEVDINALNAFILDQKPPYMVPAVTMQIEKIPLNVNQKVDKKALPKPETQLVNSNMDSVVTAPLNALEVELKAIIAEVVKNDNFGITDILGYVGLTSISGIKLATLIYKKYGVQVNAKTLAKTGTLQSIENEILQHWMTPAEVKENAPAEVKDGTEDSSLNIPHSSLSAPLSFTQQGVYTECMANAGGVQYNIPGLLTFPAGVTADKLKEAVTKVIEAHPYMQCHFVTNDKGEVVQKPLEEFVLDISVCTMTADEFVQYKKDFVRPFDLAKGPLFRFEIVETRDSEHNTLNLLFDIHHLIGDGASVNLLNHQICQALEGETIEKEVYDYYQFVQDQKIDETADEYFDQTLGGVEEVSRLLPDIFEENLNHHQRTVSVSLAKVIGQTEIEKLCHKHGITPAAFFLAASALTVSRYLCEEDVTLTTISNGRSNLKVSDTVGMFVNTLPLALHVGTGDKIPTLLEHASSVFEHAIEHETYPFARVASKYGFSPQISYTCQLGVLDSLTIREGEVGLQTLDLDIAKIPMAIYINGSVEGEMRIDVDYDSSLYTDTMAQHFAESIVNVASSMILAETVKDISLTVEKDWAQLDTFNSPLFTDYDHTDTVVSLFRKQVERHPDKTAAVYADKRYTYRELDEATDRLAAYLYDKLTSVTGKKELREEVVSIIIDRNEWVYLLPLAVLKTGCAYEPLDPSYPSDRLNYMVQDAKACMLIGQEEFIGQVNEYKGEVVLTKDLAKVLDIPAAPLQYAPKPNDLLLMLYTSGSTGKPKGVQIEHHNLVSYAHGIAQADFYTEDRVVAAYASFGFDVCMSDTFCTLLNGGTLVVIPENLRLELKLLAEYLDSEKVSQIFMTTQVGVQFLQNYPNMKYLHCLGMGGEKLPAVSPEGLSYQIINGYGPTENTCGVSLFPVKHWEPNIPLGRPFPTIQGYVLDKAGHRLPPGACGEYCVAGDQPARGYLGLPEKTAEVFVEYNGLRMYHTGDVVRYRENGDVEFVGRKDGMVKIRGFRIELKEVEAAIRPFANIKDVTVQAYDYDGGGKYLAAFVVSDSKVDIEALLNFVKSQKPPYMVPAIIMQIDRIPLTVNQKVDKKALPKPQLAAAAYVPPTNKVEEDFCAIFGEVLGVEKYSAASDFFEMGGSSIIALKVVIAAGKRGYTIVYNDVFSYTTPQTMAEHLNAGAEMPESAAPQESALAEEHSHETNGNESAYGPGTTEIAPDGYDYRAINSLLRGNTIEAFKKGEIQPVGDVLLAGATGYLGIHVLKDLIDNFTGKIYCFVRGKKTVTAERRLKDLLYYYFENNYKDLFVSSANPDARIHIIEGDATDPKALDNFDATGITVVNCAACVKHFSKGNEIEQINVGSVRNLIAWCLKSGSRLVHVSTGSVAGGTLDNFPARDVLFNEQMLYIGQQTEYNQYIHSKFIAERYIYEAILQQGLNAKVMRVGNLAPRDTDGEFQINFKSNNFMASLAAFEALGMIPYSQMDSHFEFSPIDQVARAILSLAVTPRECVCFMSSNQHRPHLGDVVMMLNEVANPVRKVEDEEFQTAIQQALSDPAKVDKMRPFMVYATGQTRKTILTRDYDEINVDLTTQVLYRLGFSWPTTSEDYVRRFLATLKGLSMFD